MLFKIYVKSTPTLHDNIIINNNNNISFYLERMKNKK